MTFLTLLNTLPIEIINKIGQYLLYRDIVNITEYSKKYKNINQNIIIALSFNHQNAFIYPEKRFLNDNKNWKNAYINWVGKTVCISTNMYGIYVYIKDVPKFISIGCGSFIKINEYTNSKYMPPYNFIPPIYHNFSKKNIKLKFCVYKDRYSTIFGYTIKHILTYINEYTKLNKTQIKQYIRTLCFEPFGLKHVIETFDENDIIYFDKARVSFLCILNNLDDIKTDLLEFEKYAIANNTADHYKKHLKTLKNT